MTEKYDSREDTEKHIKRVGEYLMKCITELDHKAEMHDYDKIHDDKEKAMFDEFEAPSDLARGIRTALTRHVFLFQRTFQTVPMLIRQVFPHPPQT